MEDGSWYTVQKNNLDSTCLLEIQYLSVACTACPSFPDNLQQSTPTCGQVIFLFGSISILDSLGSFVQFIFPRSKPLFSIFHLSTRLSKLNQGLCCHWQCGCRYTGTTQIYITMGRGVATRFVEVTRRAPLDVLDQVVSMLIGDRLPHEYVASLDDE